MVDSAAHAQTTASTAAFLRTAAERHLTLRELQCEYIDEIMRLKGRNKVQAAKLLGVDRKTLYRHNERKNHEDRHK